MEQLSKILKGPVTLCNIFMQHVYTTCFVQQNKCFMQQKLFHENVSCNTKLFEQHVSCNTKYFLKLVSTIKNFVAWATS